MPFIFIYIYIDFGSRSYIEVQMIFTNGKAERFQCRETKGDGFRLGVAATTLLAVAHIAANLHGGFMCICCMEQLEKSPNNRQLWFACLLLSWYGSFSVDFGHVIYTKLIYAKLIYARASGHAINFFTLKITTTKV